MSCEAQPNRASAFAIVSEDTCAELKIISANSSFIPLRSGYSLNASVEEIQSNEFINSLGMTKSYLGKESHTGTHTAYLKVGESSLLTEISPLLVNAIGTSIYRSSTYLVMNSTATSIHVNVNANSAFNLGEAVLVSDLTSGYYIRNIESISSDGSVLRLFPGFTSAPSVGATINANRLFRPIEADHLSFSAWLFRGNGGSIEALSGCNISEFGMTLDSGQLAECNFSYTGRKYYFNPIQITSANSKLEFASGSATRIHYADITPKVYRTPLELATELKAKMDAKSDDNFTINFYSWGDYKGKFNIASDGTYLDLRWQGTFKASSIGTQIGFDTSATDSGSTNYYSDNVQVYTPKVISNQSALSPSYDNVDMITVKNATCWIGSNTDAYLRKASKLSISVATPTVDIDDMTSETGIYERLKSSRSVTINATILFEKHEVDLFNKFIENTSLSFGAAIGDKDSYGNWTAGQCINFYSPIVKIISNNRTGDDVVAVELSMKAFVSTSYKDFYLNYC